MNHYVIDNIDFFSNNVANLLAPHGWLLFTLRDAANISSTQLSKQDIFFVIDKNKIPLSDIKNHIDILNFDLKFAYIADTVEHVATEFILEAIHLYDPQQNLFGCFIVMTPSYLFKGVFIGSYLLMNNTTGHKSKKKIAQLSNREREVFFLLGQGYTIKEITDALNKFLNLELSDGYVGNLVRKIYRKFDAYNYVDFMSTIYRLPQAYDIPQSLFESYLRDKDTPQTL